MNTYLDVPIDCTMIGLRHQIQQALNVKSIEIRGKGYQPDDLVSQVFASSTSIILIQTSFERQDYECPISLELMVDPVQCSDGFVYERANIEKHIAVRRQAEAKRQAGTEENDETRCSSPRGPIVITSPLTKQELISLELVPNEQLCQTIVMLVTAECNVLGLTEQEIQVWHGSPEKSRLVLALVRFCQWWISPLGRMILFPLHWFWYAVRVVLIITIVSPWHCICHCIHGRSEWRMCGRSCRMGPFENKACYDLAQHNMPSMQCVPQLWLV